MKKLDVSVLYVEDDLEIVDEVALFLAKRVRDLYIARDGKEGYSIFRERNPDVIITDIQMPNMDGLAMAEMIREENNSVPIVIISAYNDTEFLSRAINIDVDGYLMKPLDLQQLQRTLQRVSQVILLQKELLEKNKRLEELVKLKEKKLSSMDELLSRIFAASNEAHVLLEDGKIININQAAIELFEAYQEESYLYKDHTIETFVPLCQPDGTLSKELQDSGYDTAVKKGIFRTELLMKKYSGSTFWADILLTNLYTKEHDTILVSIRDIDQQKKLENELRRLATTDSLTGIRNRRSFFTEAEKLLETQRDDIFVLMIDIDNFKIINDTYGHDAGDVVLKEITGHVSQIITGKSIFGRLGGEEFAIICKANPEIVRECVENIRQEIDNMNILYKNYHIQATVSIGVASRKENENIDELLQKADKKLYRAKIRGKNRVEFS